MKLTLSEYHVPPVYVPLLYDDTFIKLIYGSRNSAKSDFACLKKLIRAINLPYFKCLMTRRVKEDVNKSVYSTLKTCAKRNKIDHLFEWKDHNTTIKCLSNNNTFLPLGTYEPLGSTGRAKSVDNPTDAIVDEMDELTKEEWRKLLLSLRGSEDLEVIGIFNTHTVDEEHWIFKMFFPPLETFEREDGKHTYIKSKRRNAIILHTNFLMNPYVNKKTIEDFAEEARLDPERYKTSGLGLIKTVKVGNSALRMFDSSKHVVNDIKFNPEMLVYLVWDFNKMPHHTLSLWQFGGFDNSTKEYKWNCFKEVCEPKKTVKEVTEIAAEYLKENGYKTKKIVIIADFSGNKTDDHDTRSFINKIIRCLVGFGFSPDDRTTVNPSVVTSLDFCNDVLAGRVRLAQHSNYPEARIKIQIHPSCKFHITDFKKTKTDKDGKLLKVKKTIEFVEDGIKVRVTYEERGHGVDGFRYMITGIFNYEYEAHKTAHN